MFLNSAFPVPNTKVLQASSYGHSIYGKTAKIVAQLPTKEIVNYFLKVVSLGETGRYMCMGEFESLKAINMVSPEFVPEPYAWGMFEWDGPDTYFLLTEFRDVGKQPAESDKLAPRLADMHLRSQSPTGKFGFHIQTYHGKIAQTVNQWDDSWCAVFSRHLGYLMKLVKHYLKWPEFEVVCEITLRKVVPRLLLPLQAEGRVLKPSLIHGDCWDGNTAMDAKTGHAFIFDACSFYGHNEYDIGNWRAPRHRLSKETYTHIYKRHFPVSEPAEDWDARNRLYSLCFNIGNIINIPGSQQRQV
ncbi:Fructosamine/Ketosamine-3-kinase [Bisporella sp. PMI_857]|nr:Fructosamine/Ketosamine-3-kinase [Bisporella sp. PMI_857]